MKFKKVLISLSCIISLGLGSFVYAAPTSSTITSLKKQISSLQSQIKSLQQQLNSRNSTIKTLQTQLNEKNSAIKNLQTQLDEKDLAIKNLESKDILEPLDVKYSFDDKEIKGTYSEGTVSVPQAFVYKGVIYSPIKFIGSNLDKPIEYNETSKTIYMNSKKTEVPMADLLTPMYTEGTYGIYSKDSSSYMTISGKKYYSGFSLHPYSDNKIRQGSMWFNLEGKYEKVKGLIGLQDGYENEELKVEVYGDNQLLGRFQASPGGQPLNLDIDVKGVHVLKFVRLGYGMVDIVDLTIK
jgi:TolA-binding protein